MDDDVRTVHQRIGEVGSGERRVDDQRHVVCVRDAGDPLDVQDVAARIADGLAVEGSGLVGHLGRPRVEIVRIIDEVHGDAELWQRVVEQVVRSAVEGRRCHDLVTSLSEVQDGEGLRSLARAKREGADATFEVGDALLEDAGSRIHDPRIDVPRFGEAEEGCGVLGVPESEAGGLVDRDCSRTGSGVRLCSGVDLTGLKTSAVRHGCSLWWSDA